VDPELQFENLKPNFNDYNSLRKLKKISKHNSPVKQDYLDHVYQDKIKNTSLTSKNETENKTETKTENDTFPLRNTKIKEIQNHRNKDVSSATKPKLSLNLTTLINNIKNESQKSNRKASNDNDNDNYNYNENYLDNENNQIHIQIEGKDNNSKNHNKK